MLRFLAPKGQAGKQLRLVWIAVAALLFCFILSKRLSAQPAPPGGGVKLKVAPKALPLPPPPPAASSAAAGDKKDEKPKDQRELLEDILKKLKNEDDDTAPEYRDPNYEEPVKYAKEEKAGQGGVPIHTEGPYKSPFAHPKFGGPAKVKVGFLLANLRDYDIKEGKFTADFYLSLTSDKPMPPMDLDITNGKEESKRTIANLSTFKLYRYVTEVSSPPDLHAYPFDTQELTIELEDSDNGIDQVVLVPDLEHTNLDVGFQVNGWETSSLEAKILRHYFPDRFENDDMYYDRYKVTLGIKRYSTSAAFGVFVPAFIIVLISLTGLWLPKDELEVRTNASAPMLAAAVFFHYSLTQALPTTPYLTRADKLMIALYISLLVNMIATWLWFVFDEKHEHTVFLWGRRIVPPLSLGLMAAGSLV